MVKEQIRVKQRHKDSVLFLIWKIKMQTIKILLSVCVVMMFSLSVHVKAASDDYVLGAGDMVKIEVFGEDDLTVETRLTNAGIVSYPFLGDIRLAGRTLDQIELIIDRGLRGDYLIDPLVSVSIVEHRPFFIDGEVQKPGGYPFQPGISIDKAVALAGGYTERANKNNIVVRRLVKGQEQRFQLRSKDSVFPGDIITIEASFF